MLEDEDDDVLYLSQERGKTNEKEKDKKNIKDNFRVNLMHFSRVQQCLFVSYFFFGARPTFSISFRSHQVRRTKRSEICKFASNLRCETIFQSDKNFRDSNFWEKRDVFVMLEERRI